jgi:hypothetical protein
MENKQETHSTAINYLMGWSDKTDSDYGETYKYIINKKNVTLHSKGMFTEDFKEDGKFPACISPYAYKNYEPHYWCNRIDDNKEHPNWDEVYYNCDILITDLEVDAFVVRVHHIYGDTCETHMHNCVDTILESGHMLDMAYAVRKAEKVLSKLAELHNEALGVTDEEDN